jgi:F0F1-type ATP synthase membrane subunit a
MPIFALQDPTAAEGAAKEGFNAGETIMEHVSNNLKEPLLRLPKVFGIDFSVTKHVFMLWLVAAFVFVVVTWAVRRYLKQDRLIPSGFMNALEAVVEYVRDQIVLPNVGKKWVMTWTPLLLTFFIFILCANAIGLIPIFDVIAILDHFVIHSGPDSFLKHMLHGGTTATANFNVTAALATVTFGAIIIAGSKAHGFVTHWKNIVPHSHSDRNHRHVREAVRAHDATCGEHDGRAHRHPGDSVVRVSLHRDVQDVAGRHRRRHGGVGAARGRHFRARNHRRVGAGIRLHALDGCVHWHGD